MPAKPLTKPQLADAARLNVLFKQWQKDRREAGESYSQEKAAAILGFGQSALSQYVKGQIPLNPEAAVAFAKLIGCDVAEFSEEIDAEISALSRHQVRQPPSEYALENINFKMLSQEELSIIKNYRISNSAGKKSIIATSFAMAEMGGSEQSGAAE